MAGPRVLVTGMSGLIGGALRKRLEGRVILRALNRREMVGVDCRRADIADLAAIEPAFRDIDVVVHLAAAAGGGEPWESILRHNLVGAYNVLEAARRAGVARVIFASSGAPVTGYEREEPYASLVAGKYAGLTSWPMLTHETPLRPAALYGVSKAYGEALGAFYADKYGLRVLCIRIGYADDRPVDRRRLSIWTSWRDLAQLVRIGLTHAQLRYAVVYGVSNNTRGFFDNETAFRLGYRPQDDAEQHAAAVLAEVPPEDPALVGSHAMGGWGANNDYVGPVDRICEW